MAQYETQRFAKIAASSSGDNVLVAAQSGRKIQVVRFFLVCTTAVAVKFVSGTTGSGGTELTGAMPFGANGGISLAGVPGEPWLETVSGERLALNLGAAVAVAGGLVYQLS